MRLRLTLLSALAAIAFATHAAAQDAETEKAIEKYRAMLKEDPWSNPGPSTSTRRGAVGHARRPEQGAGQCDLGKGPGSRGRSRAAALLADADRVMDVETRILWCMESCRASAPPTY